MRTTRSTDRGFSNGTIETATTNPYRPGGKKYEGRWHNGRQHGNSVYTNGKGTKIAGVWRNGRKVEGAGADSVCIIGNGNGNGQAPRVDVD